MIKTNQWQHHPQGPNSSIWCESHKYTKTDALKMAKANLAWIQPNTSAKLLSHRVLSLHAILFKKQVASDPAKPSTVKHKGVKWARCVAQVSAYLFFFSTLAFNKTLPGVWCKYDLVSVSTTRISNNISACGSHTPRTHKHTDTHSTLLVSLLIAWLP